MDDWQCNKSVRQTNMYMLQHQVACDIALATGPTGKQVWAHKYMLISRSPVFYTMFCGPMAETGRQVLIPDIETDVMKMFLQYLYSEEIELSPDTVMAVMYTAKKYSIPALVDLCCAFLKTKINYENVCTILEQAHLFDENGLKDECKEIIFSNSSKVFHWENSDFKNLCYNCLKSLLESDKLEIKEERLYLSCVDWSEAECKRKGLEVTETNQRHVLGQILFLIRFPRMSQEFFDDVVSEGNILTSEEKMGIYKMINKPHARWGRDFQRDKIENNIVFSSKPRIKTDCHRMFRFSEVLGGTFDFWQNDNLTDAISFSCSRDLTLVGVSVFAPFFGGTIKGCVRIFDESNWCLAQRTNLEISNKNKKDKKETVDIKFKSNVEIKEGRWYTVTQQMIGDKSYLGLKGVKHTEGAAVLFTFRKSPMDENNTNIHSGQIPALLYM